MRKNPQGVIGIIPARYQSQRFPGKPLAPIAGKTLLQRTWENACRSTAFDELVVATDDDRIFEHVRDFGGQVVMTPASCPTGSHRAAYVIENTPRYQDYEIVVNVQGDQPCVEPSVFEAICDVLQQDAGAVMATAATPITCQEEAISSSVVKCVMDLQGNALYFSRALIPYGHKDIYRADIPYYKHVGIYAFRCDFLLDYAKLKPTPLQIAEDLEQLPILEHGHRIKIAYVKEASIGVDTPQDISKVETLLCSPNSSFSLAASVPH